MIKLGVNVDHVATVRQARRTAFPSPTEAARLAEQAGADGITAHLREDRRHIQDFDIFEIGRAIQIPLNLEMAATDQMIDFALHVRPEKVCLVPEKREELTTEGGLDVRGNLKEITKSVERLAKVGIEVSLFVDPETGQIEAASKTGAPFIELHTGKYAESEADDRKNRLQKLIRAGEEAHRLGLRINAGHGLNYDNTQAVLGVPHLVELNIGHAIVSEAVLTGMVAAVRRMKEIIASSAFVRQVADSK
ncbi:MAG: pyridoxine 5'-phosphate synthase [Candidatus Omnitrophica bacterium]|nr:pyridoxine 5'-phosphate synthase [Candidatus Omnitrophota bacterium]